MAIKKALPPKSKAPAPKKLPSSKKIKSPAVSTSVAPIITEGDDEDNFQAALEDLASYLNKANTAQPQAGGYRTQTVIFELSTQDRLSLHDPVHRPIFKNWDFYGCELVSLDGGIELDTAANTLKFQVILKETGMNSSVCLLILGYSAPLWMPPTPLTRPWETTEAVHSDSSLLGKTFVLTRY